MLRVLTSFFVLAAVAVFVAGCGSSTSPSATVSSVTVAGAAPTVGGTAQFTATALMSDSTTKDVTTVASWQSSNTADASVTATGLVTGLADGADNISATYQSVTGSETITITD